MKTLSNIYTSILGRFFKATNIDVKTGTVIDSYIMASSAGIQEAYQEIENSKNPYFISNCSGSELDSTGLLINCPRRANETDNNYRYRIINWTYNNEAANITAITSSLLNLTYSSDAKYLPLTNGAGTGTIFLIPINYEDDTISKAIEEATDRVNKVKSVTSQIDIIVPRIIAVQVNVQINYGESDSKIIQDIIKSKVETYINAIEPMGYMELSKINQIGVGTTGTALFNAYSFRLDGVYKGSAKILQTRRTKFILDKINWSEVSLDD